MRVRQEGMTSITIQKAKTRKGKKALQDRESKLIENTKQVVFMKSSRTSQIIVDCMSELYKMKLPNAIKFVKRNDIYPFEDGASVEFISQKSDASLVVLASHSKKRPNQLCFVRLYNYQILDMYELGVINYVKSTEVVENTNSMPDLGTRPFLAFNGNWEDNLEVKSLKNYFVDFFRGDSSVDKVALDGSKWVISFTLDSASERDSKSKDNSITGGKILMRCYGVVLKKTDLALPRVELQEIGPRIDYELRRIQYPQNETWKQSIKVPKEAKKIKNVSKNEMGDLVARVYVDQQDLSELQPKKLKGLK
eukprot:NODE_14_length_51535_cov_1.125049.p24 type:complete len:308 gc:universal NODE_14_length_51535_cov_1.125049:45920-46843(+)